MSDGEFALRWHKGKRISAKELQLGETGVLEIDASGTPVAVARERGEAAATTLTEAQERLAWSHPLNDRSHRSNSRQRHSMRDFRVRQARYSDSVRTLPL